MKVSGNDHPAQDSRVLGVLTGQVPIPKKPEPETEDDDRDE